VKPVHVEAETGTEFNRIKQARERAEKLLEALND
jgi:hypothetical protein